MGDAKRGARGARDASKKKDEHASKGAESLSFEGALERLEQTVAQLEGGDMPLEQALELFEAGVELSRKCNQTLEAAERRIEVLVADRIDAEADHRIAPFESEEDPDDAEEDDDEDFED